MDCSYVGVADKKPDRENACTRNMIQLFRIPCNNNDQLEDWVKRTRNLLYTNVHQHQPTSDTVRFTVWNLTFVYIVVRGVNVQRYRWQQDDHTISILDSKCSDTYLDSYRIDRPLRDGVCLSAERSNILTTHFKQARRISPVPRPRRILRVLPGSLNVWSKKPSLKTICRMDILGRSG